MKPQILISELKTGGFHNGDVKRTRSRLDKGKAWKLQGVIKLTPAGGSIPAKCALAHENLVYPPNNAVVRMLTQWMEVGEAYSTSIEQIIAHPYLGDLKRFPYLLTVEHDNAPSPDGVLRLLEHMDANPHLAAISGAYFTKGRDGVLQAWGDPTAADGLNFRPLPPPNDGSVLLECCGIGMGFALHRMSMFHSKRLKKPWFHTQKKDGVATQDLYFWRHARQAGFRCAVAMDVKVGHYELETDTMW